MDQQWDEVIIRKKSTKPKSNTAAASAARDTGGAVASVARVQHTAPQNSLKLDDETEDFRVKRVETDVRRRIQQARQEKGMTQKELAEALNVKQQVVGEYESGKAIPNNQVLARMERALGVKLRGDLSKPLPKAKASAKRAAAKSGAGAGR